jgi:nitrogen fixation NifU-like protein
MSAVVDLLKKSGYSSKAIEYYVRKVNVGEIKDPSVRFAYTGPCGDTMEVFLKIESNVIKDAKFRAIGCAGAFASGSALMEMIRGKTLEQAEKMDEEDIIDHLGSIPKQKIHCACLAKRTLRKAIEHYRKKQN